MNNLDLNLDYRGLNLIDLRNELVRRIRVRIFDYKIYECRETYEEEEFINYRTHYLQNDVEEILYRMFTLHYIKMFPTDDTNNTTIDEKIEIISNSYYDYMEHGNIGLIPYVIDTYPHEENRYVDHNLDLRMFSYHISNDITPLMLEVLNTTTTDLK